MVMLTIETMRQLWPRGDKRVPGLIEGIVASAPTVFAKYKLNSPLVIAHAMAQFSHECGAGLEMEENLNYSASRLVQVWPKRFTPELAVAYAHKPVQIANYCYNGRMGNRPESNDGWNYRGRGLAQVTGSNEYGGLGLVTGLDLLHHPEYLSDPKHALECGVGCFVWNGCLPHAEKDDLLGVSAMLNVGHLVADPKKVVGFAQRKEWLAKWLHALLPAHTSWLKNIFMRDEKKCLNSPNSLPALTPQ